MKRLRMFGVGVACVAGLVYILHAQETAAQDSIVKIVAEADGLSPVAPPDLPENGTFWVVTAENGVTAPWPCPPRDASCSFFAIAPGQYLADMTGGKVSTEESQTVEDALVGLAESVGKLIIWIEEAQVTRSLARAMGWEAELDAPMDFSSMMASFDTNSLYLEITNVSNGTVFANLHNATNQVYAIWGATNLATPFADWQVERELWPTNPAVMPFTVPTLGRPILFLRAEDFGRDSNADGTPDWWCWKYFADVLEPATNDYDGDGTNILAEYIGGVDPNKITFSCLFTNQYVAASLADGVITVLGGVPAGIAVLVDGTNFTTATWQAYASSNITVNLGASQGAHDVWIGLRGLPTDAQQTWEMTTLVLDSVSPTITITNPANNVTFNSSHVNVSGNFAAGTLRQITVNGVPAFVHGTNFNAVNVPLDAGTNTLTAIIENLAGATNVSSIDIVTTTNLDGSLNNPVQLQATPVAGFSPLPVIFQMQTNFPGTFQQVVYDFNGDDVADFITNNLDSITNTYATNGESFPFVTIQTTAGYFSSVGGWNAMALDESNAPVRINVQMPPTVTSFASITDPVDLKWMGTNLYVLSRSTATLTEFDANGTIIRSTNGLGVNPSGFDVDASGNVYVAVTGSDQVWKLNPTDDSFVPDEGFGFEGVIGVSGTGDGEFNTPFDVAVSPDGGAIAISDSGNHRIQRIDTGGNFMDTFGSHGTATSQFDTPKGLTYDASGTLYIMDSGNNRIVMAQGNLVEGVTGTNGTALGQLGGPVNVCIGTRGVYVADTGNNRIQKFDLPDHGLFSITPASTRYAVATNLSGPYAVAAVNNFTNDLFYVADTANNRVILCTAPTADADAVLAVWNHMTARIAAGDVAGAITDYSVAAADKYQQAFLAVGMASTISTIGQIGTLIPATIEDDTAQYYFEQVINGETITFPVEFTRENGVWKILEF